MKVLKTIVASALVALPVGLAACSETISHKEEVRTNMDGSKTRTEKTIERNPDGTTTVTEDKVRSK